MFTAHPFVCFVDFTRHKIHKHIEGVFREQTLNILQKLQFAFITKCDVMITRSTNYRTPTRVVVKWYKTGNKLNCRGRIFCFILI